MTDVQPISDEQLKDLDTWFAIKDEIYKTPARYYLALRERLRRAEDELEPARAVVEAVAEGDWHKQQSALVAYRDYVLKGEGT